MKKEVPEIFWERWCKAYFKGDYETMNKLVSKTLISQTLSKNLTISDIMAAEIVNGFFMDLMSHIQRRGTHE